MKLDFKGWLLSEKSFDQKDIPQYFYLCCNFDEGLLTRKLVGVKGISQEASIGAAFFDQAMLRMPGQDVAASNAVSKVMYNNTNYMISKDMSAINRVAYGIPQVAKIVQGLLYSVHKIQAPRDKVQQLANSIKNYNNVGSFLKQFYANAPKFGFNIQPDWEKAKRQVAYGVDGNQYSSEGEWVLKPQYLRGGQKNTVFNVPPRSDCLAVVSNETKDFVDKLRSVYRVYAVTPGRFTSQWVSSIWNVIDSGRLPLYDPNNPDSIHNPFGTTDRAKPVQQYVP